MQRYFSNQLDDNKLILGDDDWYHIKTVMRMNNNDKIEVVYHSELYLCEINNQDIRIIKKLEKRIDINKEIVLVIPLLRENKMDLILQKATELGVNIIIPIKMERSIIQLSSDKEDKRINRWNRICKEASEQSHRMDIPQITDIKTFSDLDKMDGLKIVCSTREEEMNLKKFLTNHQNYDRIIIVVGPEGGLTIDEENYLVDIGFNPVSLGNKIMRVETVPLFLLSVWNYENME
ncbi:MAG: RsmE family RNA methyltransferase [Bacilli bacterium]|nr:RsmE family RNA methyltransferase [Bacilli bacterium]MDD4809164.1 RsmE family RNA methyltransferase [Bacilli bacterium]